MKAFSFIEHTADMGLIVRGKTISDLFINAARGISSYLAAPVDTRAQLCRDVIVKGADCESLLVGWLNEIIYLGAQNGAIWDSFELRELDGRSLSARVCGHKILAGRRVEREIKSVTYHNIAIKKTISGFSVEIVFDI